MQLFPMLNGNNLVVCRVCKEYRRCHHRRRVDVAGLRTKIRLLQRPEQRHCAIPKLERARVIPVSERHPTAEAHEPAETTPVSEEGCRGGRESLADAA